MIDKHFILQSTIAHGAMTEQAQHAQAKSNAAAANDDTQVHADPIEVASALQHAMLRRAGPGPHSVASRNCACMGT